MIKYKTDGDEPVFLIGHINKDGAVKSPKILEHMVDTVLQFEEIEIIFIGFLGQLKIDLDAVFRVGSL